MEYGCECYYGGVSEDKSYLNISVIYKDLGRSNMANHTPMIIGSLSEAPTFQSAMAQVFGIKPSAISFGQFPTSTPTETHKPSTGPIRNF